MTLIDPFPMKSNEARRLAATTNGNSGIVWNSMSTETEEVIYDDEDIQSVAGEDALVERSARNSGDINENIDKVDAREGIQGVDDDFLDNPLGSNSVITVGVRKVMGRVYKRLYGTIPSSEIKRTLCLSSTLFFMIGGYWLLRSLKDPVITALCGVTAIPKAKMLSVFIVLCMVSIYNMLLDNPNVKKHTLFFIFGLFYFLLFTAIALLLAHPTIGLPNQTPNYNRVLGWVSYCSIESFGSVMVSLFWSFANSNFNMKSAKASYGLLVATAQVGSILGPAVVHLYADVWGVPIVYFIGSICMLMLQGTMYWYVKIYGTNETDGISNLKKKEKKGAGILEGVFLFVKDNYVKGIFAISCLFMVEVTIIDYMMKVLAINHFTKLHPCVPGNTCWDIVYDEPTGMSTEATAAFTSFMGMFGLATNTLSFLLSFFGTSAIIRYLGVRITLLLFPSLCLVVIIMVRLHPTLSVVFGAMMILKANSYALNNPTKEMLYQPTSSAVKYKAKSWIDIFGARGSKALGSIVTNAFSDSISNLIHNGLLVGMGVATFLIWNARFMGQKFDEYMESGYIVGDSEQDVEEETENFNLKNNKYDTSCAIYDNHQIRAEEEKKNREVRHEIIA